MFIVVTVDTQQFPVAAVRRIVIVVVILVMDREFPNPLTRKFAPAPRADPWKHLERSPAVGLLLTLSVIPGFGYDEIQPVGLSFRLLR